MSEFVFTSESVTEGHPDKVCDQISDAVLDAIIANDPACRVACETSVKTGYVLIAGEITTSTYVHFPRIVRETIKSIGYDNSDLGFDYRTCAVLSAIEQQSPDIARGVAGKGAYTKRDQGAGDQGMMFGYAVNETKELMPATAIWSHRLAERLAKVRKNKTLDFLRPDGKSQVSVRYRDGKPVAIDSVVVSSQHSADVSRKTLVEGIMETVVKKVLPARMLHAKTKYYINPTGRFVLGGPLADSGLTGRKIIVDTYGGWGRHGGGAFSGKDPSKVDRSASYYARYMAKNVVAAGLADRCEIQLAYAIGVARPVSLHVDTFGTGILSDDRIARIVGKVFDPRPAVIIEELDLLRPIYLRTATYGHFGRPQKSFTWERTDRVDALRAAAGLEKEPTAASSRSKSKPRTVVAKRVVAKKTKSNKKKSRSAKK